MALLDDMKTTLRLKTTAYDAEINDLISAAKADLQLSGISESKLIGLDDDPLIVDYDPLIKRAINVYCKANFGNNPDADRLQKSYNLLKAHLSLSFEYTDSDVAGDTDAG